MSAAEINARDFHPSRLFWIAFISWVAAAMFVVAMLLNPKLLSFQAVPLWIIITPHGLYEFSVLWRGYGARRAFVFVAAASLAAGCVTIVVASVTAGVTVWLCLALLLAFAANWSLSIAWAFGISNRLVQTLIACLPIAIPLCLAPIPADLVTVVFKQQPPTMAMLLSGAALLLAIVCILLSIAARVKAHAILRAHTNA